MAIQEHTFRIFSLEVMCLAASFLSHWYWAAVDRFNYDEIHLKFSRVYMKTERRVFAENVFKVLLLHKTL